MLRGGFAMKIIAIDGGITRANPAGIAVLAMERPPVLVASCTAHTTAKAWQARVDAVGAVVADLAAHHDVHALAYELPHVRNNAQTALKLAMLCGVLRRVAQERGIPAIGVQPSQAKAVLAGRGNATKAQMMSAARRAFGRELSKDEADAVGVALAGAHLLTHEAA